MSSQLNLFDECPVEITLRTMFKYIDIDGKKILFSAIDRTGEEPYIAYIRWSDDERFFVKTSDEKIKKVEVKACEEIEKILSISFDELNKRSYKSRD